MHSKLPRTNQLVVRRGLELFATKVQVQRSCGHSTTLPLFEIISEMLRSLVPHSCFFRIWWSRNQRWNFAHFRNPTDERLRQLNIRGAIQSFIVTVPYQLYQGPVNYKADTRLCPLVFEFRMFDCSCDWNTKNTEKLSLTENSAIFFAQGPSLFLSFL